MEMLELAKTAFTGTGVGWAVIGSMITLGLSGLGSSYGICITGTQATGVLTEKPELFGKVFLLSLLPGTQGLYGLVFSFLVAVYIGLTGPGGVEAAYSLAPVTGIIILLVGIMVGVVLAMTAIYQAKILSAGMNTVARREDQFGRVIIIQALIETYAVFALLMGILLLNWLVVDGKTIRLAATAVSGG